MFVALAMIVAIGTLAAHLTAPITHVGNASELDSSLGPVVPRPSSSIPSPFPSAPDFPPEALTWGPTPPKDWPVDWRWKYTNVVGCLGRAVVSNRYVDRGGTGGYARPDYIKCSDGTVIDDPKLNDGVLRNKQGWDQLAYSLCCQKSGCFVVDDPYTNDDPSTWKCDARKCSQLVWNGRCQDEQWLRQHPSSTPRSYMCCYDSSELVRRKQ